MSLVTERFLICNKCGSNFGVHDRNSTLKMLKKSAKENGWGYVKSLNKDYCEICYKLFLLRYEELLNKSK